MAADTPAQRPQPLEVLGLSDEARLLGRAQAGDRAAIEDLYRCFAPRLYTRVLMPALGHPQAAEDALSETFRTFIEHLHTLEVGDRSLFAWLTRVARNKATDIHRARTRTGRALTSFEDMLAPLRDASEDDPAAALELRDNRVVLKQHVQVVLAELNPRYRRVLELRFLENQGRKRCAELMEVKVATFDVLLLRALRAFHKRWLERQPDRQEGSP